MRKFTVRTDTLKTHDEFTGIMLEYYEGSHPAMRIQRVTQPVKDGDSYTFEVEVEE